MIRTLFYLSISILAFSQGVTAQQHRIDSLNKVLMQKNLSDSILINTLNKWAILSRRTNKKRGDSVYNQSFILASRSRNLYGEIRALIGLSNFQREDGNFPASRRSLLQALQLAQKSHMPDLATDAVNDFYQDCFMYPSGDYIKELEYASEII
jgi:hypothetical protein